MQTLFSEQMKQKLCITKNLGMPQFQFQSELEKPGLCSWSGLQPQANCQGEHPAPHGGRIYVFIQDVWNVMILARFQDTEEGAEATFIYTPFNLLVVNEVLMTVKQGRIWTREREPCALW